MDENKQNSSFFLLTELKSTIYLKFPHFFVDYVEQVCFNCSANTIGNLKKSYPLLFSSEYLLA